MLATNNIAKIFFIFPPQDSPETGQTLIYVGWHKNFPKNKLFFRVSNSFFHFSDVVNAYHYCYIQIFIRLLSSAIGKSGLMIQINLSHRLFMRSAIFQTIICFSLVSKPALCELILAITKEFVYLADTSSGRSATFDRKTESYSASEKALILQYDARGRERVVSEEYKILYAEIVFTNLYRLFLLQERRKAELAEYGILLH